MSRSHSRNSQNNCCEVVRARRDSCGVHVPNRSHAQFTPLVGGTATIDSGTASCPATAGWLTGSTCKHITISNCPNIDNLGVTVNYVPPSGTSNGTIIFFGGGAGTSANTDSGQEATFAAAYLLAGYGTVQTAWDDDWEGTDADGDSGSDSILDAACRPYTLMTIINNSSLFHPSGAMCAQGASAGGGGVAYSLVWYGAKLFLNNAELLSGPPFSDIQQACKVPHVPDVTICGSGQYGCDNEYGNTSNWNNSPQFIDFYLASFQTWIGGGTAGSSSCNNSGGTTTSSSANTAWLDMSIVNPTGGDFDFKNYTSMAQWVCAGSASNYQTGTCGNAHCPTILVHKGEFSVRCSHQPATTPCTMPSPASTAVIKKKEWADRLRTRRTAPWVRPQSKMT